MDIRNIQEMQKSAENFINSLKQNTKIATIIGLSGELGSGKTTFVQAVARTLGITETVNSPTFVIEKIYELPKNSQFKHLIHIDAYRLESPDELAKLGFANIAADPANLILIEWPERVVELLPPDFKKISFEHIDKSTRKINF